MSGRTPPSDTFTRFTSTSPHAASKTSPASTSSAPTFTYRAPMSGSQSSASGFGIGTPEGSETPAEKVARLRAAARVSRAQQMPLIDRILDRGRRIADIAHRTATYSLIGATGVATCLSVYAIGSLMIHNRRERRAWLDREMLRLEDAQTAFLQGSATAEQLHLLDQERAGNEMEKIRDEERRRKKELGVWGRMKQRVASVVGTGDRGIENATTLAVEAKAREKVLDDGWVDDNAPLSQRTGGYTVVEEGVIKGVGVDARGRPVPAGKVMRAVQQERQAGEREFVEQTGARGGPLDQMAGNMASVLTRGGQGDWLSWLRGSRS